MRLCPVGLLNRAASASARNSLERSGGRLLPDATARPRGQRTIANGRYTPQAHSTRREHSRTRVGAMPTPLLHCCARQLTPSPLLCCCCCCLLRVVASCCTAHHMRGEGRELHGGVSWRAHPSPPAPAVRTRRRSMARQSASSRSSAVGLLEGQGAEQHPHWKPTPARARLHGVVPEGQSDTARACQQLSCSAGRGSTLCPGRAAGACACTCDSESDECLPTVALCCALSGFCKEVPTWIRCKEPVGIASLARELTLHPHSAPETRGPHGGVDCSRLRAVSLPMCVQCVCGRSYPIGTPHERACALDASCTGLACCACCACFSRSVLARRTPPLAHRSAFFRFLEYTPRKIYSFLYSLRPILDMSPRARLGAAMLTGVAEIRSSLTGCHGRIEGGSSRAAQSRPASRSESHEHHLCVPSASRRSGER